MKAILEKLKEAENAVILPHVHADGDAVATSLALGKLLEAWDIPYTIYLEEPVGEELAFLGGHFSFPGDECPAVHTAIAVDCGDAARLGEREKIFDRAITKLVIDHHATNGGFGDVCFVNAKAAATAEIIAELFEMAGVSVKNAATYLYAGLVTDTGGFRFSNTTPKTHRIAAALMEAGADSAEVCRAVFEENRLEKMRLEAAVMRDMTVEHDGKTVIATVSEAQLRDYGAQDEDTGHLSGVLRSIRGVEAGVLIKERQGEIKISMRTNRYLDAAEICKALGGGGHARAAGVSVTGTISEWKKKMTEIIGEAYGRHC